MTTSAIPFLWSNDDIGCGKTQAMQRQLDFLKQWNLKGTFFVVPCQSAKAFITDDQPLVDLLRAAMADGHDVQQHSTTHICIENGTADLRMFDLMGDGAKVEYSEKRFVWERLWKLDAIEAQINWGREVWTEAFGSPSEGYRPGCGSFCTNMYRALERLGFKWCSARLGSMTGWMRQGGHPDYPLRLEGPVKPFQQGKIIEIPFLDDVAFRVDQDQIDDFVQLGWELWEKCLEKQLPYSLLSHHHGLERDHGAGYAVHQKLVSRILDSGNAIPMTHQEYYQRLETGEFELAQTSYPGAEDLPDWHILARK